jgi:hypothetical protein
MFWRASYGNYFEFDTKMLSSAEDLVIASDADGSPNSSHISCLKREQAHAELPLS